MTTALITHADCLAHVNPEGHPERVARLEHVLHALEPLDLLRGADLGVFHHGSTVVLISHPGC